MVDGKNQQQFDLIVIGGGSGGLAGAKRAAQYGAKVAIIESGAVGGTCVHRGCVPKKLLVYAGRSRDAVKIAKTYGWSFQSEPTFDWRVVRDKVLAEVRRLGDLHTKWLADKGVTLFRGKGVVSGPNEVRVGDDIHLTAPKILVATGGAPWFPSIEGIEHTISSDGMFTLEEFPKRLTVLGGGYIAVEFASMMADLGSQVTIVIRRPFILRGFDQEIREALQEALIKKEITVKEVSALAKITKSLSSVSVHSEQGEVIEGDVVLCAFGRKPKVDGLGLETAGIDLEKGAIKVNEWHQTSCQSIYAVGDVTDRINLTPVAIDEARAFGDAQFGSKKRVVNHETIATAVFTTPEFGTVGLTEEQAKDKVGADDLVVHRARFRPMVYTFTEDAPRLLMKVIVQKTTDRVLGVHILGKDAGEIIQAVAIAVTMGATKADFDATMALHPSSAEELVTL